MQVFKIMILSTTAILYVLKRLFDQTNLSLCLHCFSLFLIYRTTVKLIQVILVSSIIYSSSIVLWSLVCLVLNNLQVIFSILILLIIDLCVSYLLDTRKLILKLDLGCD